MVCDIVFGCRYWLSSFVSTDRSFRSIGSEQPVITSGILPLRPASEPEHVLVISDTMDVGA